LILLANFKDGLLEQERLNNRGGINGRPLELVILDGKRNPVEIAKHVSKVLDMPRMLAVIGLESLQNDHKMFAEVGKKIGSSGIPIISDLSDSSIFASMPNVFSTRTSQQGQRVPVIASFAKEMNFRTIAFLGVNNITATRAIGDALTNGKIDTSDLVVVGDHRLELSGSGRWATLNAQAVDAAVADLKVKKPDLIVLAVGGSNSASVDIIAKFKRENFAPTIMLVGDLQEQLPELSKIDYPNAIYQLDNNTVPEVEPDAIRNVVNAGNPED